jgi:VIT1/CCC1 family predicted Fe2+/Mn2+ transporter
MKKIRDFIDRYLDPAGRLGEILFGLIMALGFTGAVQMGLDEPNNRKLFLGILGCNISWGVVDGVMYVLTALFTRGCRERIIRDVLSLPTEEAAMARVGKELDDRLVPLTTPEERQRIYRSVIDLVRRASREKVRIRRGDLLGGVASGAVVILATLPIVLPYLVVRDPCWAVRLSNLIGLALLFMLGLWWGRLVGGSPWRIGAGLTLVGALLTGITIALGG